MLGLYTNSYSKFILNSKWPFLSVCVVSKLSFQEKSDEKIIVTNTLANNFWVSFDLTTPEIKQSTKGLYKTTLANKIL